MKTVQTMKGCGNYQNCTIVRPHIPHSSYGTYVTLAPKVLVFPVFVQVSAAGSEVLGVCCCRRPARQVVPGRAGSSLSHVVIFPPSMYCGCWVAPCAPLVLCPARAMLCCSFCPFSASLFMLEVQRRLQRGMQRGVRKGGPLRAASTYWRKGA